MADRIKFYTDAHIPLAVIEQLRLHGVDIIRCEDVGKKYAEDHEHLEYATSEGRVIITHDDDFLALSLEWQQQNKNHAGIIYILSDKQGVIGVIVKELLFLHQTVIEGAASPEDFCNQVWYI